MRSTWHVLGAGAIGCLWAAHLQSAGFPVTLILRNTSRLDTFIEKAGITLDKQLFTVNAETATCSDPIKQLLVTTKSIDTQIAMETVRHRLAPDARIIVLQNGLGPQQWVCEQFPEADVVWGSTTDGAWLQSPFELVHAGQGITKLGSPECEVNWLESLGAGFLKIEIDDQIEKTLWRKLAINCAINPLTAIKQCQNGELARNPDYLAEMAELCHEVEQVAIAAGVSLFKEPLVEHACQVAELTSKNYSSMMQDIRHQRTTEIEYITGYLCKTAETVNVPVPANQKIYAAVKKLQDTN